MPGVAIPRVTSCDATWVSWPVSRQDGRMDESRGREDGGMIVMRGSRLGTLGPVTFGRVLAVSFDFGGPGGWAILDRHAVTGSPAAAVGIRLSPRLCGTPRGGAPCSGGCRPRRGPSMGADAARPRGRCGWRRRSTGPSATGSSGTRGAARAGLRLASRQLAWLKHIWRARGFPGRYFPQPVADPIPPSESWPPRGHSTALSILSVAVGVCAGGHAGVARAKSRPRGIARACSDMPVARFFRDGLPKAPDATPRGQDRPEGEVKVCYT